MLHDMKIHMVKLHVVKIHYMNEYQSANPFRDIVHAIGKDKRLDSAPLEAA